MARYPGATWRPLTENQTQGEITPTQIILHSAADSPGKTNLWGFFENSSPFESHFWVPWDASYGPVEQFLDTTVRGDANRSANARAISVETEDEGDPDRKKWTPWQFEQIVELVAWACIEHNIPARRCPGPYSPGIGFHTMWGAPSPWTPVSKTCPGVIRKTQFDAIIEAVQLRVAQLQGGVMPDGKPHQKMYRDATTGAVMLVNGAQVRHGVRNVSDFGVLQFGGIEVGDVDRTGWDFIERYTINGDALNGYPLLEGPTAAKPPAGDNSAAAHYAEMALKQAQANKNAITKVQRTLDRVFKP